MKRLVFLLALAAFGAEQRKFTKDEAAAAYRVSCTFIAQRLKAPATARFSPIEETSITPGGATHRQDIVVRLWVDAQNSFGAYLRERYVCYVGHQRPDGLYKVSCHN